MAKRPIAILVKGCNVKIVKALMKLL